VSREHQDAANLILRLESAYRAHEDLIAVGAYQRGADRTVDAAIALRSDIHAFLRQSPRDHSAPDEVSARMLALAAAARAHMEERAS
jgi:flagellum-specific ATP synthase